MWFTFWWQNIYFLTAVDKYQANFAIQISYFKLGYVLHPRILKNRHNRIITNMSLTF